MKLLPPALGTALASVATPIIQPASSSRVSSTDVQLIVAPAWLSVIVAFGSPTFAVASITASSASAVMPCQVGLSRSTEIAMQYS